jgi:hypothetical protein
MTEPVSISLVLHVQYETGNGTRKRRNWVYTDWDDTDVFDKMNAVRQLADEAGIPFALESGSTL